jgi:Domain of unknown function (DUF4388)
MLRGNLADFPLVGILQLISKDGKSGTIRIMERPAGAIGVIEGRVTDAIYRPSRGERALSLMNSFTDAPFEFDANAIPAEQTITRPTQALLLELHDQHLRWVRLRERLRDWSVNPQWLLRPEKFVSAEQALIADLIDGRRSVERILQESQLPALRTAELLIQMANSRMIALGQISQLSAPQALVVLSVYHPDDKTVFVDRALHRVWTDTFGTVRVVIVTPKGERHDFAVQPRDGVGERIMIPDGALRKMRISRGVKITAIPRRESSTP